MLTMHIKTNQFSSSTRWSISYIVLVPIIVCIVVVWNAFERINEFERSHHKVAKATATIVANEISKRIKNQQRLLSIFSKNNSELIYRLAASPFNDSIKDELDKKVEESFPNYFAVSIANRKGVPILDDFDGLIGELCLSDLKRHAGGHSQPIRIHPNIQAYHVDIIVPWRYQNENNKKNWNKGLLFLSFAPDFLHQLLKLSSTPRHELMLINRDITNLIEITEKGTRINLLREDFRLTAKEQSRKLFSMPVKDTVWNLVDFREETLFSEYRDNIVNYSLLILFLFIFGSVVMIVILLQAEKRRFNAERIKEDMFSLFNHDLRAPLNSIFGFLEVYKETEICEKDKDKCMHLANRAYDNSLIMREIIDDILNVQKMEAGEMSFDFAEEDVISIIKDTVDMNEHHASKNNVKLLIVSDESVIYIKVDGRRLNQAVTNLLSNAIKYSAEEEIVTISIIKNSNGIVISVSDKGPGIDSDFQNLVFEKFSQSKSKLTRRVGGTGLGLAIVKHIVNAHNGQTTFVSSEEGTIFSIELPFDH